MTLCLAWKDRDNIHFSSDSRISSSRDQYLDIAIKIFSIPVKIYSPMDSTTQVQTLDYNHTIGMCFAGNTMNAYIIKETIYEVLQHLQYIPGVNTISMNGLANVIKIFYEHYLSIICSILGIGGIASFFLAGYCPSERRIKVYKYTSESSVAPFIARMEYVLEEEGIEYLGDGERYARDIIRLNADISKFSLIKEVINDNNVPSVGGNIQYGTFEGDNFYIKGVQDYIQERDGSIRLRYCLRGTDLYEGDLLDLAGFHISYPIIIPFEHEILNI